MVSLVAGLGPTFLGLLAVALALVAFSLALGRILRRGLVTVGRIEVEHGSKLVNKGFELGNLCLEALVLRGELLDLLRFHLLSLRQTLLQIKGRERLPLGKKVPMRPRAQKPQQLV